jgi:hypothetical protein
MARPTWGLRFAGGVATAAPQSQRKPYRNGVGLRLKPVQLPTRSDTILKAWMNEVLPFSRGRSFFMSLHATRLAFDMSDPINEALLIYTGYGAASFPRARTPQLVSRFGEQDAQELKQRILDLMQEMQQPLATEGKRSKKSVTEQAIEQIRPRHPELDEPALKALAWTFAFGLR